MRTIKHGHVNGKQPSATGEVRFVESLFDLAAWPDLRQAKLVTNQNNATVPLNA